MDLEDRYKLIFVDLDRFYTMSTIWQIGVGSDRFGNILWIWFGERICVIFYGFSCLRGSGRISVDSVGFV